MICKVESVYLIAYICMYENYTFIGYMYQTGIDAGINVG